MDGRRIAWILVDGENIDATLGTSILGRRPEPDERPRWARLTEHIARVWDVTARGVFFLNASAGMPNAFVQALHAMNYVVVPLSGSPDEKVVDIAIQRTLRALAHREDDAVLVSHDADFAEDLGALVDGRRRVGVASFTEFRSTAFARIEGLASFDLEYDVRAFDAPLPRLRVIPIAEFDPETFLGSA